MLVVGLAALPVSARLDADQPWWDYREWNWFGGGKLVTFDWTHSYGPLDWPREGTTLLQHQGGPPPLLEDRDARPLRRLPLAALGAQRARASAPPSCPSRHSRTRWDERIEVTVRALRSDLVVGAGSTYLVTGADGRADVGDGTSRSLDEPLERGDSYTVRAYAPNPSAGEMRAAGSGYDFALQRYTEIYLPNEGENALEGSGLAERRVANERDRPGAA